MSKWTQFWDMHSGGGQKAANHKIYIELPQEEAIAYFEKKFGLDPYHVTCDCCGEDYSIEEYDSLGEATAYDRGCGYDEDGYVEGPDTDSRWAKEYVPLDQWLQDPKDMWGSSLIIYQKETV